MLAVQSEIYVQYGRHICSWEYANNVKCVFLFLVTLFIALGSYEAYVLTYLSCAHEHIGMHGLYMAFEGHINFWHMHSNNVFCHMMYSRLG